MHVWDSVWLVIGFQGGVLFVSIAESAWKLWKLREKQKRT